MVTMLFDGVPEDRRQRIGFIIGEDITESDVGGEVARYSEHSSELLSHIQNAWRKGQYCDVGIFVRCSAPREDVLKEFEGLPVSVFPDGHAMIRVHASVVSRSPLLKSVIKLQRKHGVGRSYGGGQSAAVPVKPYAAESSGKSSSAGAKLVTKVGAAALGVAAAKTKEQAKPVPPVPKISVIEGNTGEKSDAASKAGEPAQPPLSPSRKRPRSDSYSSLSSHASTPMEIGKGSVRPVRASMNMPSQVNMSALAAQMPEGTSLVIPEVARLKLNLATFSLSNASIEGCAFFRLVRYLYTGRLRLCDVTIAETVRACSFLHVSSAMDLCEEYLLGKLQPCNALSICALGNLFDCGTLEEQADEYLSQHFMEVTQEVEWNELSGATVKRLLSRDNLKCHSEDWVVRALYRWASWTLEPEVETKAAAPSSSASAGKGDSKAKRTKVDCEENATSADKEKSPAPPESSAVDLAETKKNAAPAQQQDSKEFEVYSTKGSESDTGGSDEDDEDEEDEDRTELFMQMLRDGSIRFAHLSDSELETLTEEIVGQTHNSITSAKLAEAWKTVIAEEKEKRAAHLAKVEQSVQSDSETMQNESDAGFGGDMEIEAEEDNDDFPNIRQYTTIAGYQVERQKCLVELGGHGGYVYAVAQAKDGSLVSGSRDQTLRVWNYNEATRAAQKAGEGGLPVVLDQATKVVEEHRERVFGLQNLSNGKMCSCSFDNTIKVWNTDTWTCEQTLKGHGNWVVALSECDDRLVSGAADNLVKVWNTNTWECEATLEAHEDHVYGVAGIKVKPAGPRNDSAQIHLLASGGQDACIIIWDPAQKWKRMQTVKKAHKASIRSLKQCGRYLASASADKTVRLWALRGKSIKLNSTLFGHSAVVETLESVPQQGGAEPLLASASRDVLIKLWNTTTKCCIRTFVGHRNWVKSLKTLKDNNIASASADGTVRVWDVS